MIIFKLQMTRFVKRAHLKSSELITILSVINSVLLRGVDNNLSHDYNILMQCVR